MQDLWFQSYKCSKKYSYAGPWPEVQAFWHFMAVFGIFAKKSNKKSNPIFPIVSDF